MIHDNGLQVPEANAERGEVFMFRPHVVILGAGASRAAVPRGDANGCSLPLMANFLHVVPSVKELLVEADIDLSDTEFEATYSRIAANDKHAAVTAHIEAAIYDYFDSLRLPPEPTVYDHLIMALRGKDVIATFNWDPLLLQAAQRCSLPGLSLPRLLFLHGNVLSGFCTADSVHGYRGALCSQCGQPFAPSRLLYPIADKDYRSDPMIASHWDFFAQELQSAFMVTIFGYSGPASDASAIDVLKKAWARNPQGEMNQLELIDIQDPAKMRGRWLEFIRFEHYEAHPDFYDSWIAKHPRRTGEDYVRQYWDAEFVADNDVPRELGLIDTKRWYRGLIDLEQRDG